MNAKNPSGYLSGGVFSIFTPTHILGAGRFSQAFAEGYIILQGIISRGAASQFSVVSNHFTKCGIFL
jgi:hypothetical protein